MQKEFEQLVKEEILNEMPYINVSPENYYDLELEKYKDNFKDFVTKLKSIVMGIKQLPANSKHGTSIELRTSEEVDKFLEQLKDDKMVMLYVWNEFINWLQAYKLKGVSKS